MRACTPKPQSAIHVLDSPSCFHLYSIRYLNRVGCMAFQAESQEDDDVEDSICKCDMSESTSLGQEHKPTNDRSSEQKRKRADGCEIEA